MGRAPREPDAWSRTVADVIRGERAASGLTHTEFYSAAGLARTTYFSLLSGKLVADVIHLEAVGSVIGIPVSVLMRRA